jgi:hypothetical protein
VRYLVFAAALVFIGGLGLLTALYLSNNGVTVVGVLGLIVWIVCGVGVIGALLHPPRR